MSDPERRTAGDLAIDAVCEGGNLDCGSGLLLLIKKALAGVKPGGILEIRSTELSVREDLPAWCRMTRNPYQGWRPGEGASSFFVRRGDAEPENNDFERARQYKWQARVQWKGGLTTNVYCRNHQWSVGQSASFDLRDAAPSAVEYVIGALGACLLMGFQVRASQRAIPVDDLEISLTARLDNALFFLGVEETGHSGLSEITAMLYVRADADESALHDVWRETIAHSPIANSLTHAARLNATLRMIF